MVKGVLRKLLSLLSLSFKEHFIYWILPLSVSMIFLMMYCFGNHWMQEFVSPQINREYGAQEAVEHIMLLICVYFSFRCFLSSPDIATRIIFGVAALLSLFIFLEEMDYGLTYYEVVFNIPPESRVVGRSVHGEDFKKLIEMKDTMYVFIMVVFVLLPLIDGKWIPAFFRKFIPPPKIILTVLALQVVSYFSILLTYQLGYKGNKSLDGNISEFTENVIYYALLLYLIEMYQRTSLKNKVRKLLPRKSAFLEKV